MQQVRSFYRFVDLTENDQRHLAVRSFCQDKELLGTVLLADEGINASLYGQPTALDSFLSWLESADPAFKNLSWCGTETDPAVPPFQRLEVRLVRSILRRPASPNAEVAQQVQPEDWNQWLACPQTQLIDVRNTYETRLGTFAGAVLPEIDRFNDFPDYAAQKLAPTSEQPFAAIYCTGGIRCEAAATWLKARGFDEVYQLAGGILNYLASVKPSESRWRGDCFVFDQRMVVDSKLQPVDYHLCPACQRPVQEKSSPLYCPDCTALKPSQTA